jgi:hypothetical protein
MGERTTKTKAELMAMLAEAVRNTQPQPAPAAPSEMVRDAPPASKRKKHEVPKRAANTKRARASRSGKQRRR